MEQKEKLLVTGGAGFIGKNLVDKLKYNYHVIVLDDFSTGQRDLVDTKNTEVYEHDIRSKEARDLAQKSDIIIHLAAMSGVMPSIEWPLTCTDINVYGTANILEGARKGNCEKFIFASSGGTILGMQDPPVHEEIIPKPTSPYGASKVCGENYCLSYYHTFDLNTLVLRFGNVYGPWSMHKTGNLIPNFLIKLRDNEVLPIYGDGSQTRDFIFIEDLIDAMNKSIQVDLGGETFQLANSKEFTVNEVFNVMNIVSKEIFDKTVNCKNHSERKGEVKRNYAIIDKAKEILKWEPKNGLDEGIYKTFKWYKEIYYGN